MGNFFSKGPDYFGLFQKGIQISSKAAKTLQAAFSGDQIDEEKIKGLRAIEHEGDQHVHECGKLIADAFITPVERPDMMNMIAAIEALTDSIDDIGNQIYMMHIVKKDATSEKFVGLLVSACEELSTMMVVFKNFKTKQDELHKISIRVNHIEEEGDALFISAMRNLFDPKQEMNTVDVIRCEHLYQTMEDAMDCCEDVADAVSHIIITNT
ncbi:MAG TPA: hypothetical protein DG942_04095 [Ruminococcaceae bacterium]|jgi:hypothetical protein|nr:hypothetical protein [Oscillospiraceae bacterium]